MLKDILNVKLDYIIQIVEETLPLIGKSLDINLLSQSFIGLYSEKYNYLHISLVQIAIKPLTREGLNNSILLSMIDKRYKKFSDSLLRVVETFLSSGHIYFNYFLNFSAYIKDNNIQRVLKVDIKTHGFDI